MMSHDLLYKLTLNPIKGFIIHWRSKILAIVLVQFSSGYSQESSGSRDYRSRERERGGLEIR